MPLLLYIVLFCCTPGRVCPWNTIHPSTTSVDISHTVEERMYSNLPNIVANNVERCERERPAKPIYAVTAKEPAKVRLRYLRCICAARLTSHTALSMVSMLWYQEVGILHHGTKN